VIIGAGTAGCVLAARLSQDPGARVLLLEAGSTVPLPAMTVPAAWPDLIGSPADWAGQTVPQADAGRLAYPRGRGLGGSGADNARAHVRSHPAVYDAWAVGGADGWGAADLLPYLKRTETAARRDPALRGKDGPVCVAPVPEAERHPVAVAFAEALEEAGFPLTGDLSGKVPEGVAWPDLAIAGGRRVSPADAYLLPAAGRTNLTVRTDCLVTQLVVERGRCSGAEFVHGGKLEVALAGEVIVCAGAVGSPQLLMLSGIGPADHLREHGIPVLAGLPGVGENLQDHPVAATSYWLPGPARRSWYNHGETYAALSSPLAGGWPDLHLFPLLLPAAPAGRRPPDAGFALTAAVMAPGSRGTVRLAGPYPDLAPLVDPGFLRDPDDLTRLEAGLIMIREAAAGRALAGLGVTECHPGARSGELRAYIRATVGSYYHPAGTCRIGTDPDSGAVVDPSLRVHGISGLRVADASVMPLIVNANLNATVLAIAEKAAALIAGTP
jgi:choline dehydrogenase